MIQSVTVVNHKSNTFEFLLNDSFGSGIYIKNIDGLGYPSSSISHDDGGFNYSISTYKKTKKQPRNIVITFGITNYGFNSVESARNFIYEMFPSNSELYMSFKSDERIRNITGYVENITPDIFEENEVVQVSIICPNPYFYSGGIFETTSEEFGNRFEFTEWFEQLKTAPKVSSKLIFDASFNLYDKEWEGKPNYYKFPYKSMDNEPYRISLKIPVIKEYIRLTLKAGFEGFWKIDKNISCEMVIVFHFYDPEYEDFTLVLNNESKRKISKNIMFNFTNSLIDENRIKECFVEVTLAIESPVEETKNVWFNTDPDFDFAWIGFESLEDPSILKKKDVSELLPYKSVGFYSKIENPTGFELEVYSKSVGYDKVIIDDENGKIEINTRPLTYSEIIYEEDNEEDPLLKNRFINSKVLVVNDYNDQNVYEIKSDGSRSSILEEVAFDGDVPSVKVGYNKINAQLFGIVKVPTLERYEIDPEKSNSHFDVLDLIGGAYDIRLEYDSYFLEVDLYDYDIDANNKKIPIYLGHLKITGNELPEKSFPYTSEVGPNGDNYEVNAYYKIPRKTLEFDSELTNLIGFYVTRNDEKQGNLNEYEEDGYYYSIWMKVARNITQTEKQFLSFKDNIPESKIYDLKVEISNKRDPFLLKKMYIRYGGQNLGSYFKFDVFYYLRLDNPLNKKTYVFEYERIQDFVLVERHDRMFDAF